MNTDKKNQKPEEKKPEATEGEKPEAVEASPFSPDLDKDGKKLLDGKGAEKAMTLRALMQEGKPFRQVWKDSGQRNVQEASARLAYAMATKGATEQEVIDVFNKLGLANASALRQYIENNFQMPSGQAKKEEPKQVNISRFI